MNTESVLSKLREEQFVLEKVGGSYYSFEYEELGFLFMPDGDDNFLRFAVPSIYDVTEENRPFVLEVVNDTNFTIKYCKACVFDDSVWIFYEHRLFGDDHLEELLEHTLKLLQAAYYLFYRKIEGDDTLPSNDDDNNDPETMEDE